MTEFIPSEKAVPIREASTANLLVDSTDRLNPDGSEKVGENAANFTISLNQSILNGYFTRIAVSEVVVDWCVDNISAAAGNNSFAVYAADFADSIVALPDGQYTVAAALDAIVARLNVNNPGGHQFSLTAGAGGIKQLSMTTVGANSTFKIRAGNLQTDLNFASEVAGNDFPCDCPKILPYTYIDICSDSLTYNQALKDATTNVVSRNILYRWYFAWDNVYQAVDAYGYPIYQGYNRFISRRALPFPKQIRWSANQPIGQLSFKVFTSQGTILSPAEATGEFEWQMTLLVSEV